MTTARITADMLDGTKLEAEGPFRAFADKRAFEVRFKMSYAAFQRTVAGMIVEGEVNPDADLDPLTMDTQAFMPWRLLVRAGQFEGDLDEFVNACNAIEIHENEEPDPTVRDQPPGTSPS